eukprot:897932-Pleurochrysis_carterae.AAC.1
MAARTVGLSSARTACARARAARTFRTCTCRRHAIRVQNARSESKAESRADVLSISRRDLFDGAAAGRREFCARAPTDPCT